MEKIDVIERAANRLLQHNVAEARRTIETEYPFHKLTAQGRNYTEIGKAYQHKVEVVNVITVPEIEMLIICNERKYQDFEKKKGMSPSEYCKSILKMKNVKSVSFEELEKMCCVEVNYQCNRKKKARI